MHSQIVIPSILFPGDISTFCHLKQKQINKSFHSRRVTQKEDLGHIAHILEQWFQKN